MKALRFLLAAAAAAGLFYVGLLAADSPALSLKTVELVGDTSGKVKLEDVVSAGGFRDGASLLKLPTEKAARGIESLPWVLDAKVERILPSTIRVTIVERKPAFVVISGPTPWLLDKDGVVLEQGESGLIHLMDLPLPPLHPGRRVTLAQFQHAAKILRSLPSAIRIRINRIRARSVDRITLELVDGSALVYGAAEEMEDKNYAAERLLELYRDRAIRLETIDVRVPSRPAVKPRTEPGEDP